MAMKKILQLCDKHGLFKPIWCGTEVDSLKFGPVGEFLVNNVRQEWLLSNVINRDESFYPIQTSCSEMCSSYNDIEETYTHIKAMCGGLLPFGMAQTGFQLNNVKDVKMRQPHAAFDPARKTFLRSLLFVSPMDGRQSFYSWQQKRKMWWRKFSSHPGRFSLSDIKESNNVKSSKGIDLSVDILAEFEWGTTIIETIHLFPLGSLGLFEEQAEALKVKDGRQYVSPYVVECISSPEVAALAFLCDAFSENSKRNSLRLHRRLAPLKAGFVMNLIDSSLADRLLEVAKHMSRSLRQDGLTTLLLPDISKKSHDAQLARNDEMGIPFTIVLSDSTLNDGIIHLYSRETTLKEQVHISKIPDYMKLLVKNY